MHKCLICSSNNVEIIETKVSDFLLERMYENKPQKVNLIHCKDCGFAYYDLRPTDEEMAKLYVGYRDEQYQKQRQKHECWYTKEINELIGKNEVEIKNRKENFLALLKQNVDVQKINKILDFGGDKGQHIPDEFIQAQKYVYEISNVEPVEGVEMFSDFEMCKKNQYDLIMCCHTLEHVSDPFEIIGQIKQLSSENTYLYIELPFDSPFFKSKISNLQFLINKYFSWWIMLKHFIKLKRGRAFQPMIEHINFFTPESVKKLLENSGFEVLANNVKEIDCEWCNSKIISVLAKFKQI